MSGEVSCFYCGEPIDPSPRRNWQRVTGWQHTAPSRSSRRGGSDIVLREATGEWACAGCVDRLRHGLAVGQESIL